MGSDHVLGWRACRRRMVKGLITDVAVREGRHHARPPRRVRGVDNELACRCQLHWRKHFLRGCKKARQLCTKHSASERCLGHRSVRHTLIRCTGLRCMKTPLKEKRSPPADADGSCEASHCRLWTVRLMLGGSHNTVFAAPTPPATLVSSTTPLGSGVSLGSADELLLVRCTTTASSTEPPTFR